VLLDRLARDVYRPYASFWQGYLGDEAKFRDWAGASLFASDHPIHTRLEGLLDLRLDSLFTTSAIWLVKATGRRPRGVWYIVFGPGWTDMGGCTDGTMVADFAKLEPDREVIEFKLPHELTHMVHGASAGQRNDPDSGTVLQRIVSEGLASYATYMYAAGRRTAAQSTGYTDAEWAWALDHEQELTTAAQPYLRSRSRPDLNRFASGASAYRREHNDERSRASVASCRVRAGVIAALGGNWLLGRKSIGASTLQLVAAWVQILGGATVAWWAWRRSRLRKDGPAV